MSEDFQERTEKATPKKLADARKKGLVAKSQELTVGILLLGGIFALYFFSHFFHDRIQNLFTAVFNNLFVPYDSLEEVTYWFRQGLLYLFFTLSPLLLVVIVIAFLVNVLQVGFLVAFEAIKPRLKNINCFHPANYKRFFDSRALVRFFLGIGKVMIVSSVCYLVIKGMLPEASRLMNGYVVDIYHFISWNGFRVGLFVSLVFIVLGVFDFMFQRWKFQYDMRMTKQEVRDERKQTEGDVHVKSRMRSMMRSFSQDPTKDSIPQASMVIVDSTRFAVAIQYDAKKMSSPICVSRGARRLAGKIREIAEKHEVPIEENPRLARALYEGVEVGASIPSDFYHSVAQVLANLKNP